MLTVNTRIRPDAVILVSVSGEIDMATVGPLDAAMVAAITRQGAAAVEVDFAGVTFCDSLGMAALDKAYAAARRQAIPFRLINVQPGVSRMLQLTGLDALISPEAGSGPPLRIDRTGRSAT
jgi:anti-anti-sigma factor